MATEEEVQAMIDPVCGMTIEPDMAAAAWEYQGETYYFCSMGCFERFKEDPERFVTMDPFERGM